MFRKELSIKFCIYESSKYLTKNEYSFLRKLYFWSSHHNNYGVKKDNKIWIYNTLDQWSSQLAISKSSVRRTIKTLKGIGLIGSAYLSSNKRNRTLYYSIDIKALQGYLSEKVFSTQEKDGFSPSSDEHIVDHSSYISEHMDEHMYIESSKQKVNKSNKSFIKTSKKSEEKPTLIQDMVKIFQEEFPKHKVTLTKELCRYLVAAFKTKFKSSLKEWRKYLQLIKTSTYLIGEKFKLYLSWLIKFVTIDRIYAGELGVKPNELPQETEEIRQETIQQIESLDESVSCKQFRKKMVDKLTLPCYRSWFKLVSLTEEKGKIIIHASSNFVRDYFQNNFSWYLGDNVSIDDCILM